MEKAYDKIVWENSPSTTTPLNATNLNEMSDALDTIDNRVIALDILKVDKDGDKVLSDNNFSDEDKVKLDNATSVSVEQVVTQGTTLANITVDGTTTAIIGSDIDVDNELSTESENPVQNKVITTEINKKANSDDTIESAYSLATTTPIPNDAVYMKRNIPVKDSFKETLFLVGATVNANQLVDISFQSSSTVGGMSYTNNGDGSFTVSGKANESVSKSVGSAIGWKANHIYYMCGGFDDALTNYWVYANIYSHIEGNKSQKISKSGSIIKLIDDYTAGFNLRVENGYEFTSPVTAKPMVIDLTAYFGASAIPDKAYTMEQTESGSGIAWLKSYGFFTEDYIAYRANGLESVRAEEKVNVGFNQWDGTKFDGYYINSNGVKTSAPSTLNCSCTDFIKVIPNTQYYFKGYVGGSTGIYAVTYYDENKTFLSKSNGNATAPFTFTTPVNCCFIACNVKNDLFNTFCINISSPENGKYEPYHAETISFDTSKTLRGLYTLDGDSIKAVGDIYNADGEITRNYEERAYQSGDESLADAITDGTNTVVKLTTPTTESATPFTANQQIDSNGTEEFVDYGVSSGDRDFVVPVGSIAEFTQKVEIPSLPSENGEYSPKLTVSDSGSVWSWVTNS